MEFGLQNSVMGWDDPWHAASCRTKMRTGEGQFFPSQDPMPSKERIVQALKELGVDFYLQHVMPEEEEMLAFVRDMEKSGLGYLLGNEFGNINGPYTAGTNRYDVPVSVAERAAQRDNFMGLLYDETEHLQLHPDQYRKDGMYRQWLSEVKKTREECEDAFVSNVKELLARYPAEGYAECVFPALMHLLARGGMNLCPKALKEEYQSIQFAIAMGACRQYGRKMGICVDLWGFDVGGWFTRLWGFPAHGVNEFYNALLFSYHLAPEFLFVENCDALLRNTQKEMTRTEFGETYARFLREFRGKQLPYTHRDVRCRVAVIHADDGLFSKNGTFGGRGCFGFGEFPVDERKASFFDVMHLLSHKTVSSYGTTFWNTDHTQFPTGAYRRDENTFRLLPLEKGVGKENETSFHRIFYPLDGVLVFDDLATRDCIGDPELIVLCGDRCRSETLELLDEYARQGTRVLVPSWLYGKNTQHCERTEDLKSGKAEQMLSEYAGRKEEWNVLFARHKLCITNPSGDGNTLNIRLEERSK